MYHDDHVERSAVSLRTEALHLDPVTIGLHTRGLPIGSGLPDGNTAEAVRVALAATVQRLPKHLWESLTWDQGKEMAQHVQFTVDTGVQVYFCDPNSPWQRGTNENTNGLLRQYFPKGTDMSQLTQHDLDEAAYSLNTRPRQTLNWMTPSDKLAEALQ